MDEMSMLYQEMPSLIKNATDMSSVMKADAILTNAENMYPELMEGANKYIEGFAYDSYKELNIFILGADGHNIAHGLRDRLLKATVIWIPNINMPEDGYDGKMHGIILSEMAVAEFLSGNGNLDIWIKTLIKDGFLLFRYDKNKGRARIHNLLNRLHFVLNKWNDNGVIYSVNKSFNELPDLYSTTVDTTKCRFKKVYCVCPALIKTGGTELMHQLVYQINKLGGDAEIAYTRTDMYGGYADTELMEYVTGHVTVFEDIEDKPGNVVIFPESWTNICDKIHNAGIWVWWMSVDNFKKINVSEEGCNHLIEDIKSRVSMHLVQSEYARQYILSNGIHEDIIQDLSDYINDIYMDENAINTGIEKKDIVVYNPKKGMEFVYNLINEAPDIKWTPIEGMTTEQVKALMQTAKVYIDFGNHPGKDRLPREAAMSGCVVITGRRGSAAYYEDVSIPEKYRLDESYISNIEIIELIKECLNDYNNVIKDFDDYRKKIASEKDSFIGNVRRLFIRTTGE